MLEIHGELTLSSTLAVGDFAARASELVDLPEERLLGLLRGATPLSVASDELRLLLERLREDPGAAAVLEEGDPTTAIDRLGEWDDAVGEAARAYLDLAGQQLVGGYDIAERRGVEVPEQIVAGLRAALARGDARQGPAGSVFEEVRAAIPDRHRQEVDDLVTEARLGYRLREERSLYGQSWAGGIMRRAVLEAGSRLARARRVHDAEHAVETSSRELRRLLSGRRGPSADELRLRFEERLDAGVAAPPATLGPRSAGAPVDRLPPGARRAAAAGDASYRAIFDPDDVEPRDPERVTGRGVSTGLYEGRARLIAGPADFGRLERGDVLVTVSTSASFNVVLPLLGAVVTDRGGALSHAAIVAREYGIPGVVGCRDATHRLTDGARVRVSGDEGYVEQLDAP
jgi:pyruvate,water dikinase